MSESFEKKMFWWMMGSLSIFLGLAFWVGSTSSRVEQQIATLTSAVNKIYTDYEIAAMHADYQKHIQKEIYGTKAD